MRPPGRSPASGGSESAGEGRDGGERDRQDEAPGRSAQHAASATAASRPASRSGSRSRPGRSASRLPSTRRRSGRRRDSRRAGASPPAPRCGPRSPPCGRPGGTPGRSSGFGQSGGGSPSGRFPPQGSGRGGRTFPRSSRHEGRRLRKSEACVLRRGVPRGVRVCSPPLAGGRPFPRSSGGRRLCRSTGRCLPAPSLTAFPVVCQYCSRPYLSAAVDAAHPIQRTPVTRPAWPTTAGRARSTPPPFGMADLHAPDPGCGRVQTLRCPRPRCGRPLPSTQTHCPMLPSVGFAFAPTPCSMVVRVRAVSAVVVLPMRHRGPGASPAARSGPCQYLRLEILTGVGSQGFQWVKRKSPDLPALWDLMQYPGVAEPRGSGLRVTAAASGPEVALRNPP